MSRAPNPTWDGYIPPDGTLQAIGVPSNQSFPVSHVPLSVGTAGPYLAPSMPYQAYPGYSDQTTYDQGLLNYAMAVSYSEHAARAVSQSQSVQTNRQSSREIGPKRDVSLKSQAEALSYKYWSTGSLGYTDPVIDGFYMTHGDFPEICDKDKFPSLEELKRVQTEEEDIREVVYIDLDQDSKLRDLKDRAAEAVAAQESEGASAKIEALAKVVSVAFGGSFDSEDALNLFWRDSSREEKKVTKYVSILLGRLRYGTARHRSLLFKMLADPLNLRCKLLQGRYLSASEDTAVCFVNVNGREELVDLVYEPGRMLPPDQLAGCSSRSSSSPGVTGGTAAGYEASGSGSARSSFPPHRRSSSGSARLSSGSSRPSAVVPLIPGPSYTRQEGQGSSDGTHAKLSIPEAREGSAFSVSGTRNPSAQRSVRSSLVPIVMPPSGHHAPSQPSTLTSNLSGASNGSSTGGGSGAAPASPQLPPSQQQPAGLVQGPLPLHSAPLFKTQSDTTLKVSPQGPGRDMLPSPAGPPPDLIRLDSGPISKAAAAAALEAAAAAAALQHQTLGASSASGNTNIDTSWAMFPAPNDSTASSDQAIHRHSKSFDMTMLSSYDLTIQPDQPRNAMPPFARASESIGSGVPQLPSRWNAPLVTAGFQAGEGETTVTQASSGLSPIQGVHLHSPSNTQDGTQLSSSYQSSSTLQFYPYARPPPPPLPQPQISPQGSLSNWTQGRALDTSTNNPSPSYVPGHLHTPLQMQQVPSLTPKGSSTLMPPSPHQQSPISPPSVSPAVSHGGSLIASPAAWMQQQQQQEQQRLARSGIVVSSTAAASAGAPLSSSLTQISNHEAFADLSPFTSQPPPPRKTLSQQQQEKSTASVVSSSTSLSSVFNLSTNANMTGAKQSGALGSEDFPVSISSMNSNDALKPGLSSRSSTQEGDATTSKPISQSSLTTAPSLSLQRQQIATQVGQQGAWAQPSRTPTSAFEFQAASVLGGSAWGGANVPSLASAYQDAASASGVIAVSPWVAQPLHNHSGAIYQQQQQQGGGAAGNAMAAPAVRASPFAQGMPYMTPLQQQPGHLDGNGELHEDEGLEPVLSRMPSLHLGAHNDWEINHRELTFGPRIGIGSYGEVYKGTWRGTEVAIKRLLEQNLSASTVREFRDETSIMARLRHPNVVLFMGAVVQPNHLAIVTQFCPRGPLYDILHRRNFQIDSKRRLSMAADIARGMLYLHSCSPPIVHRDLKSPNLLVDKDWTIKVCDFGLSRVKNETFLSSKSQAGTWEWAAPESLRNEQYDEKCDVFSFGVILYELVACEKPWAHLRNRLAVNSLVATQHKRLDIPQDIQPEVKQLMTECWEERPERRPSFAQVLQRLLKLKSLEPSLSQQSQVAERERAG
ncbi:hypothetical protein CEUSTIGMA_g2885.t1 [Chlamydomonas eustigma]|uniref:non-specific serine/threonine protein kinase n=1 Tax=Chlamydomonas eustigma TaxID=1157962 RepID=A0A250WXA0_9CHLO|nr:hypothetical protein CEUSTIGMA_g2885.t1 [Chlamydomonas eustigma]|eukprot:GAX75441.1 hypothetical protein CEUSTIGMA_g2885.t1 [Chlamydomonas eustigma]